MAEAVASPPSGALPSWVARWPLLVGFVALGISTVATLGKQVWTREQGAHGPIILATGAWLLWRQAETIKRQAQPAPFWPALLALTVALPLFVFGRAFDFISLETLGLYLVGLAMFYATFGFRALWKSWFPFFYLAFLIPPPGWVMNALTAPLKQFVSHVATSAMFHAGLPIAREGVTIHVGPYQLLVEDACSGMNSLVGLTAISLFYIYLLRGSSMRYAGILTLLVVPIAIVGNIGRIIVLILLTYFMGDEVAQSFAHEAAGLFLFGLDLLLVFLADSLLARVVPKSWLPAHDATA
jgi:exosortase